MLTTSRMHLIAALLVTSSAVAWVIGGSHAAAHGQAISSYTVTLAEVLTTRDGASRVVAIETQARRDDGATVLQLGPEGETGRHIRMPGGLLIDTNDRDKRMSTFHVSPASSTGDVRNPQENCRRNAEEFLGEEPINAYRAAKIVSDNGVSTRWYALEYSCALVGSVMEHAGGSRSEKRLINLRPGPPPEALFQTHNYTEGPPSTLAEGGSCDAACERWRRRRDAEYYRLRPQ